MTEYANLWSPEVLLSETLCSNAKGLFVILFKGRLKCTAPWERCIKASNFTFVNLFYICLFMRNPDWLAVLARGLVICHEKYVYRYLQRRCCLWAMRRMVLKDWLISHREPTCPPPRLSFNSWPRVKMAASHAGRLGSQSDQFSGSQETSASLSPPLSLPASLSLSNHLFGACGQCNRDGELRLILLRFNHSLQRVSCFSLSPDGREGENEAQLNLAWIPVHQTQTRLISPFIFTVLAPVWQLTLSFL